MREIRYRIQDTRYKIQDTRYRIQDIPRLAALQQIDKSHTISQ